MQTRQEEKFVNSNRHYSLRKLSVGLASVLIGISFLNGTKTTVNADTITASTKTGEISKAGNLEVAGNSKDLSAFSMSFNGKNGENETAKADTTSDQTTQTGDQAETKNQENKLVDQINYKLTNNTSTDNKEDLGQNLTAPDETKSTSTTKSDAEKSIVSPNSAQKINNQSDDHAENNSQTQNEQKLDITKNSKKLAKKVLATNLIETTSSTMTNGGFDEATWGKLDVNDWQGSVQNGVYQLTGYTGDLNHIIVPNEADFEKAGKSTNGLQVGIIKYTIRSLRSRGQTIAFSKTNNQKVKAIGTDWSHAFSIDNAASPLSKFDGSNLDVSSITNMCEMFGNLGSESSISDLTSLKNWNTSNVTNMSYMFSSNKISDLTPLANWNTSKVTDMRNMFDSNSISDLTPLANWDTSKVTDMSFLFANNPDIIDLSPIANWNISSIGNANNADGHGFSGLVGLFVGNTKLNLSNINNAPLMQGFLKKPDALYGTSFITNNADLVKATINKDLPTLTNTAKRTITFSLPHVAPKTIVQIINYKTIAPVQISLDPDSGEIVQTYPLKDSDWYLDTSKQNDDVIIDDVICFKPVKIPHVNGYKAYLIKDPVNPTAFLVSFMAVPEQPQNNQSISNNVQSSQKTTQAEQKQPEPIQNTSAPVESDKQVDQILNHIAFKLMHNSSSNADNFEPAQNTSDSLEAPSDSTQKDDAVKTQKVNTAKHKQHIVKKRAVKRRRKNVKKYHLKRRLRKHTKRSRKHTKRVKHRKNVKKYHLKRRLRKHTKRSRKHTKRVKHRKSVSRKFRKYNLKHVKKA